MAVALAAALPGRVATEVLPAWVAAASVVVAEAVAVAAVVVVAAAVAGGNGRIFLRISK